MSESKQTNSMPDDLLADFTDHVLGEKASTPDFAADAELRDLQETVLRLKQAFPQEALDERTARHMQANFKARVRKSDSQTIPVWQFVRPRQRLVFAFAAVALAAFLIVFPFLTTIGEPVQGTAGLEFRYVSLLAGALCAIGLLIWVRRRK